MYIKSLRDTDYQNSILPPPGVIKAGETVEVLDEVGEWIFNRPGSAQRPEFERVKKPRAKNIEPEATKVIEGPEEKKRIARGKHLKPKKYDNS